MNETHTHIKYTNILTATRRYGNFRGHKAIVMVHGKFICAVHLKKKQTVYDSCTQHDQ